MFGPNEKYIARIMFQNKIYSADGQMYENLFTSVMQRMNPNFEQVKPYGNIGDWKNDGFDKTSGTYYQVYAPEDIARANTPDNATKKLNEDFDGVYKHWNTVCPINSFNYVINDKYKNLPPQIHNAVLELGKKHPEIEFRLFKTKDLEDCFMSLSDDDMVSVVGFVVNPNAQLDYSALSSVITHLMNIQGEELDYNHLVVPDFEEKIKFNKLSPQISSFLTSASYQVGSLERYFKNNSEYTKADIQQKISSAYITVAESIDSTDENYADKVFMKLLDSIYPNGCAAVRNAVLILMAYFFETCDIFKRPEGELITNDLT